MKILFIPGLAQNLSDQNYRDFFNGLQKKDHDIVGWQPDWNTLNLSEGEKIAHAFLPDCMVGFSLGAVCAFQLAQKVGCRALVLCSPAPFTLPSLAVNHHIERVGIFFGQEENKYIQQMSAELAAFYEINKVNAEVLCVSDGTHEMGILYQKKVLEWLNSEV